MKKLTTTDALLSVPILRVKQLSGQRAASDTYAAIYSFGRVLVGAGASGISRTKASEIDRSFDTLPARKEHMNRGIIKKKADSDEPRKTHSLAMTTLKRKNKYASYA